MGERVRGASGGVGSGRRAARVRVAVLFLVGGVLSAGAVPAGAEGPEPTTRLEFVDPVGRPVGGVCVEVGTADSDESARSCAEAGSSSLAVTAVPGGLVWVRVVGPEGFARFWHPRAASRAEAQPIMGGALTPIVVPREGVVEGTLRLPDGEPAVGASVVVEPLAGGDTYSGSVVADGTFRVGGVLPARYRVLFTYEKRQRYLAEAAGALPRVVGLFPGRPLVLQEVFGPESEPQRVTITGEVRDMGTYEPESGACVVVSAARLRAWSTEEAKRCPGGVLTDVRGRFALSGVRPGSAFLAVWSSRDHRRTYTWIDPAPGALMDVGTMLVWANPAVEGRALDARTGKPISGVCPTAVPLGGGTWGFDSWCSDQHGVWRLEFNSDDPIVVYLDGGRRHRAAYAPGVATQEEAEVVAWRSGMGRVSDTYLDRR